MTKPLQYALIAGVLVIIVLLSGTFYTLQEGEQAVIVQFGRPVGEPVTDAGLHVKVPFIQDVRRFEKRLLIWDGDPNQVPTAGREFIWIDTTARWRISDPKTFLESVANENGAQSRLDDIIDSVVRDLVSSNSLIELVRSGDWETPQDEKILEEAPEEVVKELQKEVHLGREEITRSILKEAQKITPQYGIEVVDVRIKRLNYIESVRERVYDRMISERQRIASRFRSEGEGRSAEILGDMEKELREIRSTAYRRVQEVRGEADAKAAAVYGASYGKDPEFYAFSRTLEALKEGQNEKSVLMLTTDSDYYRYLKNANPPDSAR